jgi:hypothetical protein
VNPRPTDDAATSSTRVTFAWSVFAITMLLTALATLMWIANARKAPGVSSPQVLVAPAYGVVGAVVVAKRRHIVGWLFLVFAVVAALTAFSFEFSVAAFATHVDSFPRLTVFAWLQQELWPLNFVFLGLLLLLFPDGRTPSPLFGKVLIVMLASWLLADIGGAIYPSPLELLSGPSAVSVPNPAAISGHRDLLDAVLTPVFIVAIASLIAASLAPIVKWRRGSQLLREQMRWPAFVVAASLVAFLVTVAALQISPSAGVVIAIIPMVGATVGLPVAVGVAILRYRLFEIDRIVNRAIVYGALTAVLAGAYVVVVFALRALLGPLAGSSDVAVAGSTLAVAALFRPVRSRLQSFIDRRFYRRRFDAQRTIEEFNSRVRAEVDLDSVASLLTAVVGDTLQPAHVSLWLRPL